MKEQATLLAAMSQARAAVKSVAKSGHNTFDHYDYSTLKDYIASVEEALTTYGLVVIVEEVLPTFSRTEHPKMPECCDVVIKGRVAHAQSGESIAFSFPGRAFDRNDKALYKAVTGARKYALAGLFNIYTADDVEQEVVAEEQTPKKPARHWASFEKCDQPADLKQLIEKWLAQKPLDKKTAGHWVSVLSDAGRFGEQQWGQFHDAAGWLDEKLCEAHATKNGEKPQKPKAQDALQGCKGETEIVALLEGWLKKKPITFESAHSWYETICKAEKRCQELKCEPPILKEILDAAKTKLEAEKVF